MSTPVTVTPASNPPKTSGPKVKPIMSGVMSAIAPGIIISLIEALVEIATHLSYSGFALYSIIPGISLN